MSTRPDHRAAGLRPGRLPPRQDGQRRLIRTIALGTLAVFGGIAWLASEIGMDTAELAGYAGTSALLVLGLVVLAVAGAAALRGIKRLLGRAQGRSARNRSSRGA